MASGIKEVRGAEMITNLKPYAEYKESGLPWLGRIPRHWDALAVKQAFNIQLGKMLQNTPQTSDDSSVPYLKSQHVQWSGVRTADLPRMWASPRELVRFGVRAGDLLVCEGGEGGRCAVISSIAEGVIIQNALHRVRPRGSSDNRFLAYAMAVVSSVGWFAAINNKATIAHFTRDKFGRLGIPLPPPPEQTAIVQFLGWMDERLERAIRAKRKVITLLNEQKQVIIYRAVTRGLDPSSPLKPSGLPWLGDVPQHWEIERIKNVFRLRTQKSGLAHGKELLSIYTHIGVRPRKDLEQKGNKASTTDDYWIVRKGDLIVNKLLAWMGAVGSSAYDGVTSPAYDILMPIRPLCSDYYHHLFRTKLYLQLFKQRSRGIMDMRLRLYFDQLGQIPVPFPPVSEQRAIVAFYDEATADLTDAISRLEREIELLREYRTRLVADVVTGKLDVSEAAAALPEESLEADSAERVDLEADETNDLDSGLEPVEASE